MPPKKPTTSSSSDIEQNKLIAILSYVSILCLIPLLMKKESAYVQFHAKQGVALLIVEVLAGIISWTVILAPISAIIYFVCLIASVYGMYLAWSGKMTPLPVLDTIVKKLNI